MIIKQIAKISNGQDGAIYNNHLFRFDTRGNCQVYDLLDIEKDTVKKLEPIGSFILDKAELIVPHSNSVCWGTEFYAPNDEYPLLYSNIYNNYAKADDKLIGVCCVYRVERAGKDFKTTLVQLIEIGFTDDHTLWKAFPDRDGVRPYGNFVIDCEAGYYYAFVMRNETLGTRYFKFKIPSLSDGEADPIYGVKRVVLTPEDICDSFDCPYHRYVQGAIAHGKYIYSTEGFHNDQINRPAIRIIDLDKKIQERYIDLLDAGYQCEPEMIDFYNGVCYYSDVAGNLYSIEF